MRRGQHVDEDYSPENPGGIANYLANDDGIYVYDPIPFGVELAFPEAVVARIEWEAQRWLEQMAESEACEEQGQ